MGIFAYQSGKSQGIVRKFDSRIGYEPCTWLFGARPLFAWLVNA